MYTVGVEIYWLVNVVVQEQEAGEEIRVYEMTRMVR